MTQSIRQWGVLAVILAGGCALDDEALDPGEVASETGEIRSAPTITTRGATVMLEAKSRLVGFPPVRWTGVVLSDHWLLTAGHAFGEYAPPHGDEIYGPLKVFSARDADGVADDLAYQGRAEVFVHPDYVYDDAGYDLALVYLDGPPVEAWAGRARLYDSSQKPWVAGHDTWTEGVGKTGPDCIAPEGQLRGYSARSYGANGGDLYAIMDDYRHCNGDSGGPWGYLFYDGINPWPYYLQFGVHHGSGWTFPSWRGLAANTYPFLSWMEQIMDQRLSPSGVTSGYATVAGHRYRMFPENKITGTIDDGTYCFTATSSASGAPVEARLCSGMLDQVWESRPDGVIASKAYSGKCISGGTLAEGFLLRLEPCSPILPGMRFRHHAAGAVYAAMNTTMCIDRQGGTGPLQMYPCNGTQAQRFFARTTGAVTWKTLKTYYSPSRGDNYTTATSFNLWPDYFFVTSPGKIASTAFQPSGAKPLWNWWSPGRQDNFLTSDPAWAPGTSHFDYVFVRHEGYVFDLHVTGSPLVALYTYWSPSREDNFATRTAASHAPDYWFVRTEGYLSP